MPKRLIALLVSMIFTMNSVSYASSSKFIITGVGLIITGIFFNDRSAGYNDDASSSLKKASEAFDKASQYDQNAYTNLNAAMAWNREVANSTADSPYGQSVRKTFAECMDAYRTNIQNANASRKEAANYQQSASSQQSTYNITQSIAVGAIILGAGSLVYGLLANNDLKKGKYSRTPATWGISSNIQPNRIKLALNRYF